MFSPDFTEVASHKEVCILSSLDVPVKLKKSRYLSRPETYIFVRTIFEVYRFFMGLNPASLNLNVKNLIFFIESDVSTLGHIGRTEPD